MHVVLQPAYLLHVKPYRETSVLAELFTQDFGRLRGVIQGMRQPRSRYRGMRPFAPLLVSCRGKTDLLTITDVEYSEMPHDLMGDALFCGFYLNELLMRLLVLQDAYPTLFSAYQTALKALTEKEVGPVLRQFEWAMLTALGYGFSLDQTEKQIPILEDHYYVFDPKKGFLHSPIPLPSAFKGSHLLNFKQDIWPPDMEGRSAVKRLMQLALAPLLGNKPLKTRTVFLPIRQQA